MTTINMFQNSQDAVAFKAGETIFNEGDAGETVHVVVEGSVEIGHHGRIFEEIGVGGLFGEMALLDSTPRSATARARTDCRVVPINQKRFLFLVQQHPFFALQMMRIMSERLRRKDQVALAQGA